jgi:ABC-type transporter Mla subunit MlaD
MDKALPNPILVVKYARSANDQADTVLASARAEAEQTVRLRAKAETALREAERLVSKAKEYIEDHSSDVGANAKANLRKAKENLDTARDTSDLERCIAFAEGAEEKARYAYNEAKEDVAEANEEDDSDTTVVVWGNSTPVYQPSTRRETTSTWSAPTPRSNSGGGSLNWGGSSQRGSSISIPRSTMGGGSKKW